MDSMFACAAVIPPACAAGMTAAAPVRAEARAAARPLAAWPPAGLRR
jgi:hypothetical protein